MWANEFNKQQAWVSYNYRCNMSHQFPVPRRGGGGGGGGGAVGNEKMLPYDKRTGQNLRPK